VNDEPHYEFVADTVRDALGQDAFQLMASPQPGAEDFSRVLEQVPGAYMFLGAEDRSRPDGELADNHSPYAVFDEAVLWQGALVHTALAVRTLAGRQASDEAA
jgi:hippurate hydrolase